MGRAWPAAPVRRRATGRQRPTGSRRRKGLVRSNSIGCTVVQCLPPEIGGAEEVAMLRTLVLAGLVVTGSFQTTAPAGPVYDVKFTVPGNEGPQVYTGTTTFVVDAKGGVSGKFHITTPTEVTATLNGTVKGGTWTFDYPYTIPAQACSGTVKGSVPVSADRKSISGDVVIGGACTESPLSATFIFTLQEKKGGS